VNIWWWLTKQIQEILLTLMIQVVNTRDSFEGNSIFRFKQHEGLELSYSKGLGQ
jgi:hypothetical protein